MELFREEYLTIQDDYLRVDPSREESDDQDVDYDNDDLGENTEITPLGDAVEQEEVNDFIGDPGDDDDFEGDDVDIDVDEDIEEDGFVDVSSQVDPDEYDDEDLEEDFVDDDEDLLSDDDNEFDDEDEPTARTSIDTNTDFASRPHGRITGTMLDHEPGLPGSDRL
jgi:hypothetical protein